jgi:hypothetical protein
VQHTYSVIYQDIYTLVWHFLHSSHWSRHLKPLDHTIQWRTDPVRTSNQGTDERYVGGRGTTLDLSKHNLKKIFIACWLALLRDQWMNHLIFIYPVGPIPSSQRAQELSLFILALPRFRHQEKNKDTQFFWDLKEGDLPGSWIISSLWPIMCSELVMEGGGADCIKWTSHSTVCILQTNNPWIITEWKKKYRINCSWDGEVSTQSLKFCFGSSRMGGIVWMSEYILADNTSQLI